MSFFEKIFDGVAWLKIFLSPFIAGLIIGLFLWFYYETITFRILAVLIGISGLIAGIYLAERVRRKIGAQKFISKLSETPDLERKL